MTLDRPQKKRSTFHIAVVVNVILFALIGFGFIEEYLRNREIEAEISRMNAENAALEENRLASLQLIDKLSSAYYVEGEARQSGMGKDGERLVILENHDINTVSTAPTVQHDDIPNPLRWYYYFFDQVRFQELEQEL
jgi:cell division protein FtsB